MMKFAVSGMSCAACSARVEKAVSALEGVEFCAVNLLTNSMTVDGDVSPEVVIDAVKKAGYGATLDTNALAAVIERKRIDKDTKVQLVRLAVSIILSAVLMYFSMGHSMAGFPIGVLERSPFGLGMVQMILALAVMGVNYKFFVNGAKGLFHKAPNMDTLVALGSLVSYLYSLYILINRGVYEIQSYSPSIISATEHYYFDSSAMILTLIAIGKTLEMRAKGKTTSALESLMKLAPKTATIIRDGVEIVVDVNEMVVGDVFVVRPGEQIPVDGIVIDGGSAVDESALTGESMPVDKEIGHGVSAGTFNTYGFLKCEAMKVGEDTTLANIIRMVSDASATKAPISKLADKVAGVFVPVVMGIAVIVFIAWFVYGKINGNFNTTEQAFSYAITTLVVACPCALGLATPVAIMVGTGRGAKSGILFKTATALEQAGKVKIVVLDKTGTITEGKPSVVGLYPTNGIRERELLTLASSLEQYSEHPLARAILEKSEEENIVFEDIVDFQILPGNGLKAILEGKIILGGSVKFVASAVQMSEETKELCKTLSQEGKTPLCFAYDGKVIGVIAVRDKVKEDSKDAVSRLQKLGVKVVMLTGDNQGTARAIAEEVGITEYIAEVLPDGKDQIVKELQKQGKVAMVGDGINDAVALTSADTGIAISAGTDVAIDAADVVLMGGSLSGVVGAIILSKKTMLNIKENLFWAFFYNCICISISAGILVPIGIEMTPMIGALAMSVSSVSVVLNALRLNFARVYEKNNSDIIHSLCDENCDINCGICEIEEDKQDEKYQENSEVNFMEKTMKIEGMMCPHCENRVRKTLEGLEGVESAVVSHAEGTAVLNLSKDIDNDVLKKVVEDQGYPVLEIK